MAQLVDLLVDVGVFLDVEVVLGHVGFGLVVVVVGDEVFDGVVGEEVLELLVKLGGQGLVVGEHEGGLLGGLDYFAHDESLAGAVAPSKVCFFIPLLMPSTRPAIASGWSPVGTKSDTI